VRFEFVRMRPGDHLDWVFTGSHEFDALATSCLMEGAAKGELLMYVSEDPDPSAVAALSGVASEDDLRVVSTADVYGTSAVVDPQAVLENYYAELAAAMASGHSGLRIVSDNTPLLADDEALAAWLRWELLVDQFLATHPVTALCAFDALRLDRTVLSQLAVRHPLSSASSPVPRFRLFFHGSSLQLAGPVNEASLTRLREALADLPEGTPAAVTLGPTDAAPPGPAPGDMWAADLDAAAAVNGRLVSMLNDIVIDGTPLTVFGSAAALGAVRAAFPPPNASLVLRQY
jgi:MEDS: MEthanogen/methylotroph, DcmR Sensory domain